MEVHNQMGNGFQEVVYQRALSIELNLNGIEHERELEMPLEYKGYDVGTRRVDFFCRRQSNGRNKSRCEAGRRS